MENPTPTSIRKTQKSVTCFLQCGDRFLFVHRNASRTVDPNRLNGIGGKLEPFEDFLHCAIRETTEETGFVVSESDCMLRAVVNLEGGYPEDWVMCFFIIQVPSTTVPKGLQNEEGELLWLEADKVLESGYELVDDLNYCWQDLMQYEGLLFIGLQLNETEKIEKYTVTKLPRSVVTVG